MQKIIKTNVIFWYYLIGCFENTNLYPPYNPLKELYGFNESNTNEIVEFLKKYYGKNWKYEIYLFFLKNEWKELHFVI